MQLAVNLYNVASCTGPCKIKQLYYTGNKSNANFRDRQSSCEEFKITSDIPPDADYESLR